MTPRLYIPSVRGAAAGGSGGGAGGGTGLRPPEFALSRNRSANQPRYNVVARRTFFSASVPRAVVRLVDRQTRNRRAIVIRALSSRSINETRISSREPIARNVPWDRTAQRSTPNGNGHRNIAFHLRRTFTNRLLRDFESTPRVSYVTRDPPRYPRIFRTDPFVHSNPAVFSLPRTHRAF